MTELTRAQREFLTAVRDGKEMYPIFKASDVGFGWAVDAGYVIQHPKFFEFRITPAGRLALQEKNK